MIYSYCVETDGVVTDVLSFYTLPSTVIGNPKHSSLKAAYSFCAFALLLRLSDTCCPFFLLLPAAVVGVLVVLVLHKSSQFF